MCRRKRSKLGKGEVIQHDRDGSTALGSLELLMRPPSSLSSTRLSANSARVLSFSLPCPLSSSPFFGLHPPSSPFKLDVPVVLAAVTAASLFQRADNGRNVIAQLRGIILATGSTPASPGPPLHTLPTTRHRETSVPTFPPELTRANARTSDPAFNSRPPNDPRELFLAGALDTITSPDLAGLLLACARINRRAFATRYTARASQSVDAQFNSLEGCATPIRRPFEA